MGAYIRCALECAHALNESSIRLLALIQFFDRFWQEARFDAQVINALFAHSLFGEDLYGGGHMDMSTRWDSCRLSANASKAMTLRVCVIAVAVAIVILPQHCLVD